MIEITLILVFSVVSISIIISKKMIKKGRKEYYKSQHIIEEIVLSFNRELKREANRFELTAYKADRSLVKSETSIKKVENLEKKILLINDNLNTFFEQKSNFLTKTSISEDRIKDIDDSTKKLENRIEKLENNLIKIKETPKITRKPVIPIRREKAMAAITETEITVLELLSKEGGKTAPQIKNRINLSREHVARLMKKLYEKGYLERETGKIPFIYNIKEEMENILNNS